MGSSDAQLRHFNEVLNHYEFEIPDYQRGYSWSEHQWAALWRDIQNMAQSNARQHFTGMMLVRSQAENTKRPRVEVVDGQQRLITVMILANALRKQSGKVAERYKIKFNDNQELQDTFSFYALGAHSIEARLSQEPSSYALNIKAAAHFFQNCVQGLSAKEASNTLAILLDKFCLFILEVSQDFDIHIAFETLNNRGRPLSKMELLKNRLIYLTTTLDEEPTEALALRAEIHTAWKGIYRALGRSTKTQNHDDEFLLAHSTAYFRRSRQAEWLDKMLFETVFAIGNEEITFALIRDYIESLEMGAAWWSHMHAPERMPNTHQKQLERIAHAGFANFKPLILSAYLRVSSGVRGLVSNPCENKPALTCVEQLLIQIERFIVIVFRLLGNRGSAKADMEAAAYTLLKQGRDGFLAEDYGINSLSSAEAVDLVAAFIKARASNAEDEEGSYTDQRFEWEGLFSQGELQTAIDRRFHGGDGFYKWDFTRLTLYEYETSFRLNGNNPVKLGWDDFSFDETVEHIYPCKPEGKGHVYWEAKIAIDGRSNRNGRISKALQNSLGNLLFLSRSSNSAASNEGYSVKQGRVETGKRARYQNASYSATEVSQSFKEWNAQTIAVRGVALLKFVEQRWDISLTSTPDSLKSYLPLCFGAEAGSIIEGKAGKLSPRSLKKSLKER